MFLNEYPDCTSHTILRIFCLVKLTGLVLELSHRCKNIFYVFIKTCFKNVLKNVFKKFLYVF